MPRSTAYPYTEAAWEEIRGRRCADCAGQFSLDGSIAVFSMGEWKHLSHAIATTGDGR